MTKAAVGETKSRERQLWSGQSNPNALDNRALELRSEGGKWLKAIREAACLSQTSMGKLVGGTKSWFTQLENGSARLPSDKYKMWADALRVDAALFVRAAMTFYDPVAASVLGFKPHQDAAKVLESLLQRKHAAN